MGSFTGRQMGSQTRKAAWEAIQDAKWEEKPENRYIFNGVENYLIYDQFYNDIFECEYFLHWCPFVSRPVTWTSNMLIHFEPVGHGLAAHLSLIAQSRPSLSYPIGQEQS